MAKKQKYNQLFIDRKYLETLLTTHGLNETT